MVRRECFYSCVPIMFSTYSQQVFQVPNKFPMMFPKGVPGIASLYNILVWTPCLMHRWNKNPTLSQNHNLLTYLPTHLPIEFPTYLCASFPTSQALVPTFSFPAFSLPTLPTFSLFLSKTTLYLATYLRACLPPSLVLFPTSLAWLREKAKSR